MLIICAIDSLSIEQMNYVVSTIVYIFRGSFLGPSKKILLVEANYMFVNDNFGT